MSSRGCVGYQLDLSNGNRDAVGWCPTIDIGHSSFLVEKFR